MSKHVSFPASHLSHYEIGKRIRVITVEGAKIEDTLTELHVGPSGNGNPARIRLRFASVGFYDRGGMDGTFEVAPDQHVKRIDED